MLRALTTLMFAIALTLAGSGHAAAQEQPRITRTTFDPASATVGDRITLTIEIEHPAETTIEGPRFDVSSGELELLEIAPPRTTDTETTLRYTFAAFETGRLELGPLDVQWRSPDGEGVLRTPVRSVEIDSVVPAGDSEMKPLKPQLAIVDDAPPAIVPALFVAVFVVLTLAGYRLVKRAIDARPVPVPEPVAPILPADAARASLDELAASRLAEHDAQAFYASLAGIVRTYLAARFEFPAYAMTRSELEPGMRQQEIDRFVARVTGNLLEQCDAVVFAGFRPPPARVDADLTAAYEIVERTLPVPEPDVTAEAVSV